MEGLDSEMQVALRAALEVCEEPVKLEECLVQVNAAIQKEEAFLEALYRDRAPSGVISVVEADVQWKKEIMKDIPIGVTADQLRAIHVLVKSRPFLKDLLLV